MPHREHNEKGGRKTSRGATATLVALGLVILGFALASESFFSLTNFSNILLQVSVLVVVGCGLVMTMIAGEMDISFGGTIGLFGMLFALLTRMELPLWLILLLPLLGGLSVGLFSGVLVTYGKLSSFVATLSVMFITMGVENRISGANAVWIADDRLIGFFNGLVGPIPNPALIAMAIVFLLYLLLTQTRFGIHLNAVGENAEAARAAGVPVERTKLIAFVIAGCLYGVASLLSSMRSSGALAYAGQTMILPALGVCFIGQTVSRLQKFNIPGTALGALILGVITNGLTLVGASFYLVPMVQGAVLVIAAGATAIRKREIQQV